LGEGIPEEGALVGFKSVELGDQERGGVAVSKVMEVLCLAVFFKHRERVSVEHSPLAPVEKAAGLMKLQDQALCFGVVESHPQKRLALLLIVHRKRQRLCEMLLEAGFNDATIGEDTRYSGQRHTTRSFPQNAIFSR
jgi:hypothetical protein